MKLSGYRTATIGDDWEHGLPVGNGTLGALVYGEPARHEITIAHERVVLPTDPPRRAPDLAPDLSRIRELIAGGRAQHAAELGVQRAQEQGYPGLQWTDPLVPSASIVIETADTSVSDYRRTVEFESDLARIEWCTGGGRRCIEVFASRSENLVAVRLRGFDSALRIRLQQPENAVTTRSGVKGGNADLVRFAAVSADDRETLTMRFTPPWEAKLLGADSTISTTHEGDDVIVFSRVVPVYRDDSVAGTHDAAAAQAHQPSFDALLDQQITLCRETINVVGLSLGSPPQAIIDSSTEELFDAEGTESANHLVELQHRSGQRLIAGSTGEYPPTLQGVWSGTFDPAWSSDYTMNGNVQNGSIASMLSAGNPRQLRSFLDMLEGFSGDFTNNAERLFGARGFVLPSRCSPTHGACTHFDAQHCHEYWTAGGAWAALFFFDYVWHTGDLKYLEEHAYPFARQVEAFYEDFLVRDPNGRLRFSPSYSPENRSPSFGSQACANATMDRAALVALLNGLLRAAALLQIDAELEERRRSWLETAPPYRIAPDGTLAEWLDDGVEEELGHRTSSQLLGTWFEPEVELVRHHSDAIARLVRAKLAWRASGGHREEMAYGLVQLGIAAAAVGDAELALECVDRMSRLYFLPSLSTTHDVGAIFNVDIAGGFPAVIHAMLLGSTVGELRLLPALPQRWSDGSISGLHARGAVIVDELEWTPSELRLRAHTTLGARRLRACSPLVVTLPAGWRLRDAEASSDGSWAQDVPDGGSFVVEAWR